VMKSVNLIPNHRRASKCRRAHLRRCAVGCAIWGVLSLGAAGMCHALWGSGSSSEAEDRLAKVLEDIQRTDRAIASVRKDLETAQSALRANQAIANQPDWSILLGILGRKVGNEVVLKSCRLRPADARASGLPVRTGRAQPVAGARSMAGSAPYVLEVSGMAKSPKAASAFVLALDDKTLFARVTLLNTAREPFYESDAIAFKVECSLDELPTATAEATGAQPKSGRTTRQAVTSSTAGDR